MDPIVKLSGHEGKVMSSDAVTCNNEEIVVSVSYDRTVKIWAPQVARGVFKYDEDMDNDDDQVMQTL